MTAHRTALAVLAAAALAAGIAGCSTAPATATNHPTAHAATRAAGLAPGRRGHGKIPDNTKGRAPQQQLFDVAQIAGWMHLTYDTDYQPGGNIYRWHGPHGLSGIVGVVNSASAVSGYFRADGTQDQYFVCNRPRTLGVKLLGGEDHGNDVEALAALQAQVNQLPPG